MRRTREINVSYDDESIFQSHSRLRICDGEKKKQRQASGDVGVRR